MSLEVEPLRHQRAVPHKQQVATGVLGVATSHLHQPYALG
jgi:hypothetical protein